MSVECIEESIFLARIQVRHAANKIHLMYFVSSI